MGFTEDVAREMKTSWDSIPQAEKAENHGPFTFVGLAVNRVQDLAPEETDFTKLTLQDDFEAMTRIGMTADFQNVRFHPRYDCIRSAESRIYWIMNTIIERYYSLEAAERDSAIHVAINGHRLADTVL